MTERVYINDLTPITDIQDGAKLLVDQNGYKKMFYSDFVVDIADTLRSEQPDGWNAQLLDGTDLTVESPSEGETVVYDSATSSFVNKKLDSNNIDWSNISVNQYQYLQVNSSGVVDQSFIEIPSLRADNDTSSGFFLRVKSGSRQIEAVQFDPDEFTINAQTLEGNAISDLDNRYLRVTNDLQDINNPSIARASLEVLSEAESDARYLAKNANLSDINNPILSFDNIKQNSTTSYAGVLEIGTSPEVQDGLRSDVAVVPTTLKDNYYGKSISDSRFLKVQDNLNDLTNKASARNNLNVFSTTESDARYLQKGLNLSELTSKSLARDNLEVYSKDYIDGLLAYLNGVPTGTVFAVAMPTPPDGYIKCNGALLDESVYPELFAQIGRTFGGSEVDGTFAVPDLRGEFIRGWDDGRGVDTARYFGTTQLDQMQRITGTVHAVIGSSAGIFYNPSGAFSVSSSTWSEFASGASGYPIAPSRYLHFDSAGSTDARVSDTTDGETRPRNVALLYCIKY